MNAARIPVTVIVMTRNNAPDIARCLEALKDFDEVIVVDSASTDGTIDLAKAAGARIESFIWNKRYPKKKQWCIGTLSLRHDWVFLVDVDEVLTPALVAEIRDLFKAPPSCAGYFIRGLYVTGGHVLKHGLRNNKIALLNRQMMEFPVIDDLDLPGMGEVEGHYQPVLKANHWQAKIGQLKAPLLHYAWNSFEEWEGRHKRYAAWERGMNERNAWPVDPVAWRQALKLLFRRLPGRALWAFAHCYIFKRGFLDGHRGLAFAALRYKYYRMI